MPFKLNLADISEREKQVINFFKESIVGQDEAIKKIVTKILNFPNTFLSQSGIGCVLLLLGNQGVGKNLLVEKTAEYLFGNRLAYTRVNLKFFKEMFLHPENINRFANFLQRKMQQNKFTDDKLVKRVKELKTRAENLEQWLISTEKNPIPPEEIDRRFQLYDTAMLEISCEMQILVEEINDLRAQSDKFYRRTGGRNMSIILFEGLDYLDSGFITEIVNMINKGVYISSSGVITPLSNSIVFFTCDSFSEELSEGLNSIGIKSRQNDITPNKKIGYKNALNKIRKILYLKFLKTLGKENIVVFNDLKDFIPIIVNRKLDSVEKYLRIADIPTKVTFTEKFKSFIAKEASDDFNKEIGASAIDRVIEERISKPLQSMLRNAAERKTNSIKGGEALVFDIEITKNNGIDEEVIALYKLFPNEIKVDKEDLDG